MFFLVFPLNGAKKTLPLQRLKNVRMDTTNNCGFGKIAIHYVFQIKNFKNEKTNFYMFIAL